MFESLEETVARHAVITEKLFQPELAAKELAELNKERARLEPIVEAYRVLKEKQAELLGNKALLEDKDAELRAMAKDEVTRLEPEITALEEQLKVLLLPRDPNDDKDVILEIRAGTGGDEASLFAGDLFTMYGRYALLMGWQVELLSSSEGTKGGFKEVVAAVRGQGAYSKLKQEAGVHRVQRVPETEAQGRIHTSAATVAVLPEAEETDVDIKPDDLDWQTMRAGGAGGQHVNKTESAVRLTHRPSGIVVVCMQERSQQKNRTIALRLLSTKLLEKQRAEEAAREAAARKGQVGSGDRSEKIRTYNFPQDRCTDHRVGHTAHNLARLMTGDIEPFLSVVRTKLQAEQLAADEG
ncbi:MAG: peptide chain release factor 1 [Deltaproteobacteria bacterium]|nr:peptide chain release factor 1 [Deltaproteobacteria bacterium]